MQCAESFRVHRAAIFGPLSEVWDGRRWGVAKKRIRPAYGTESPRINSLARLPWRPRVWAPNFCG